jgi:hypothetical protein
MNVSIRAAVSLLVISSVLAACGGDSGSDVDASLDTDYSALRIAVSREGALIPAATNDALLRPVRNGVRLSLNPGLSPAVAGLTAPMAGGQTTYSGTTVQVEGVDESDLVKYDGRHIFTVRPEAVPTKPGFTRNVLRIARTNPATATLEVTTEFDIAGEQSTLPSIYQLQAANGAAEFIAAVSQDYQGWLSAQPQATSLVVWPDRTKIQLLDVRDPYNVSQAWEIELDGWLRGSRKIGDTLYLVNSYRPRLSGLTLPAETETIKQTNERRIRAATANDLLPKYRVNGGAAQLLATPGDCVIAADLAANEAYTDLLVITAIDLSERRVTDVTCASTNVSGVYVSNDTLYVGGEGLPTTPDGPAFTMLHKFALQDGNVSYRASGAIGGRIGWVNASYFMDEHEDYLRVVSSQHSASGNDIHRLSVLRETTNHTLTPTAILPSPEHPQPVGKPGEQVHAVRFVGERAYIVTARVTDPLYVIDLADPFEPFIAGSLEIPGVATYLRPFAADNQTLLLSIGRETDAAGLPQGVKIELFDVSDLAEPASLGRYVVGAPGSSSEAIGDPHALTVLSLPVMPGEPARHRIALPIDVFAWVGAKSSWSFSGLHLLEIDGNGTQPAQLRFRGVIRTEESSGPGAYPPYVTPRRGVLHDNAVYAVHGDAYASRFWPNGAL